MVTLYRYLALGATLLFGLYAHAARPNVIIVMTDDQGYGDISAHGNPVLKTPALDELHAQSVRFTDFHVAPMCTPTRGQLMSGLDAMRNGAIEVNGGRSMMRSDLKIMPQYFKKFGYNTGMFGKWHLGDSYPFAPRFRGFEEVLRHRHWGITSSADYWDNTYFNPVLEHNGVDKPYEGYCTDIFFDAAMEWMETCQKEEKPFFAYIPTNTPHTPNQAAEKYSKAYEGTFEGKAMPSPYYGMIANIDENIGRLESFLSDKGLRENTILIFLSDNGTQSRGAMNVYNAGMKDKKTSVYDGGHRVPLFIRWPEGKLAHGEDVSDLAQVQDLLPTLMDLCVLKGDHTELNGVSLAGLLKDTDSKLDARMCVVQYLWRGTQGKKWESSLVMRDKWRLIAGNELYNIVDDPSQKRNLIDEYPEIVREMAGHYDAWFEEVKGTPDEKRYFVVGSDKENPIKIYSNEWYGDYCTNPGALKRADAQGIWYLDVAKSGEYEIELRRWPEESGKALRDSFNGKSDVGAVDVYKTRLRVGDLEENYLGKPADTTARFLVKLKKGKTTLSGDLLNIDGDVICSAPYLKMTRK